MRRVVNECHSISVMTANMEGGSAGFVDAADDLACFDAKDWGINLDLT